MLYTAFFDLFECFISDTLLLNVCANVFSVFTVCLLVYCFLGIFTQKWRKPFVIVTIAVIVFYLLTALCSYRAEILTTFNEVALWALF